MAKYKSKRSNATDISEETKRIVWERDNHCCVVCGHKNAAPNSHYIRRSHGGLGIEQNVVTLCTNFGNSCHHKFDNGTQEEQDYYKEEIREYLMSRYPNWDESKLVYRNKWDQ